MKKASPFWWSAEVGRATALPGTEWSFVALDQEKLAALRNAIGSCGRNSEDPTTGARAPDEVA